jgi:hypothetical protein
MSWNLPLPFITKPVIKIDSLCLQARTVHLKPILVVVVGEVPLKYNLMYVSV